MRYKMIVFDLDGTLANNKGEIIPRTKQALMQARAAGVHVVLASGCPTYGIVPLAEGSKLKRDRRYVLAFNRGEVIDCTENEVLSEQKLDRQLVPILFQGTKKIEMEILAYQGEGIAATNKDDEYVQHEAFINKISVMQYDDFLSQLVYPINKCLIVGDPTSLHELEIRLAKELEGKMGVYRSTNFFLECVPLGIDKTRSPNRLISSPRISHEEVIVCDDGYDDLNMIRFAGLGIAITNATKDIQNEANFVTLSNEEDGVARIIERFVLSPENMN